VYNGYTGKILNVDLTNSMRWVEKLNENWVRNYIGGEGFGAIYLAKNLHSNIDPLSEENKLLFICGPLTGTKAPCSGRTVVMFKSPLTGTICAVNAGGTWAPQLRRAGYDMLVIHGRAKTPTFLSVSDENILFHSAEKIWGKDTLITEESIRKEINALLTEIASIGIAGEKLVRFAAIMMGNDHAAGRGGGGTVMGSKNLKAIAVYGPAAQTPLHNADRFGIAVKKAIQELYDEPFVREEMMKFGTPSFFDAMNGLGLVPAYKWQHTTTDFNNDIGYETYHKKLNVKQDRCFNCPIGCIRKTSISEGKYKGLSGGGPEYETLAAFGQKLGNTDLYSIAAANYISNDLGLDVISAGQVIATAMEWYEKGVIDNNTTEGLDLSWGNSDAIVELVERIARRRDSFATLLGEGSLRAAHSIGNDAEKYVMHVKGPEMAADGVRASKAEALSHIISPRGADHLRPYGATIDVFGYLEEELGIKERVNPLSEENKDWVKSLEELSMATNLLGVCLFASITLAVKGKTWAEFFSNATGLEYSYRDLFKVSERVLNLERLFNIREGFTRKDDYLPERFSKETAPDGPGKGQVVNQDRLLDIIYTAKGWDEQGIPTKGKLEEQGLTQIASKMFN
jgi:aldehyde:ferredoxin oxidoreductase